MGAVRAVGRNGSRDRELVQFVGRHGIVTLEQVMSEMGVGRTASYRRVATCVELGLLERLRLLRDEPTVLRATRNGLNYVDLGLPVASVTPGLVNHDLRCVNVARRLARRFGHEQILTEREFTWRERTEGKEIARVDLGEDTRSGRVRKHRADLAVMVEEGTIAIEVELSAKAPTRLRNILFAWRRAHAEQVISAIYYFCAPGTTMRAVKRAIEMTGTQGIVKIGDVTDE